MALCVGDGLGMVLGSIPSSVFYSCLVWVCQRAVITMTTTTRTTASPGRVDNMRRSATPKDPIPLPPFCLQQVASVCQSASAPFPLPTLPINVFSHQTLLILLAIFYNPFCLLQTFLQVVRCPGCPCCFCCSLSFHCCCW